VKHVVGVFNGFLRSILPCIRKRGMYPTDELLDNQDLLIVAVTKLK
jgi:hypothetical protein